MRRACILALACLTSRAGASSQAVFGVAPRAVTPVSVSWRATPPLARGLRAWASGRRPEAQRWFRLAVGVAPNDPIAWHDLGVALYSESRYEDAFDAFIKERFLAPRAASASYGVGEAELALGQPLAAERDLVVAISLAPREWEYWETLADVYEAEHRDEAAKVARARAVALRPRPVHVRWSPFAINQAILSLRIPPTATFR